MSLLSALAGIRTGHPIHASLQIAGHTVDSPRRIDVRSPYSGALVGSVPMVTAADVERALRTAKAWRSPLSRHQRATILLATAERLRAASEAVSDLISAESGLSKADTRYEVGRACDVFTFAAHEALRDDGATFSCDITPHGRSRKVFTTREPLLGVISAITPFNHPLNQVAHKVAPAIASNNRMVLKPSEKTPLSALLLAEILRDAGLPAEMFTVLTGDPADIAAPLLSAAEVDLVSFTGGVAVGKQIAARAVYKRQVLELGGNDPLIVMEDADLDEAAALAASGSYKNSGQRCTAIKRILVQETVAAPFIARLVENTLAVRHGDPFDECNSMGTLIDEAAAIAIEARVSDAIARGARLLCGHQRNGALYAPTVLDRVDPSWPLVAQETFGPVSPVIRFRDIDEAIAIVNAVPYGLSSAVCTNRMDWITRFVRELQVGTVNIREVPGYRLELTPFGGIKDSGLGYKEGVLEAIKGFTNLKTWSLPW